MSPKMSSIDPFQPINQPLVIRAKSSPGGRSALPGVVMQTHKYLWYYTAQLLDGTLIATLHLGEGILAEGETSPWRVMRRDNLRTLLLQTRGGSEALATYYPAGSGVNGRFYRVTDGDSRLGGFDITGRGWRGGLITRREDKQRAVILRGEGDPPDVYFMEPVARAAQLPSLASALLIAYILTEREVKEGSWVKRPDGL